MAPGMKTLAAALTTILPLLIQPAAADIDYESRCEEFQNDVCLTSFISCVNSGSEPHCSVPDYAYPFRTSSDRIALLWSSEYNLTWTRTDPEYPVLVEWTISTGEPGARALTWDRNLTNGETSFSFKFSELAEDFDDMDPMEVKGRAGDFSNHIMISQPGRPYPNVDDEDNQTVADISDLFIVLDGWAADFLDTQRKLGEDDMYDTWKLGVGIGVGLGVPLFMAVAFLAGLFLGRRRKTVVAERKTVS